MNGLLKRVEIVSDTFQKQIDKLIDYSYLFPVFQVQKIRFSRELKLGQRLSGSFSEFIKAQFFMNETVPQLRVMQSY